MPIENDFSRAHSKSKSSVHNSQLLNEEKASNLSKLMEKELEPFKIKQLQNAAVTI